MRGLGVPTRQPRRFCRPLTSIRRFAFTKIPDFDLDDLDVNRLEARLRDVEATGEALRPLLERVARLRREIHDATSPERKAELERQLEGAIDEATAAHAAYSALVDAVTRETGIPDDIWEAIDAHSRHSDPLDRTPRASVRAPKFEPTGNFDALTPAGLEFLRRTVPREWLRQQLALGTARLEPTYLSEPLVLVRGMRVASERRAMHRLAQSVAASEDFLRGVTDYDWHAGALLVPQVAALGQRVAELRAVEGEVDARIASLWRDASEMMDSTLYELLVATACVRTGRRVEFLTATQRKTPDLRVHDLLLPLTVECKRRARLVPADLAEDAWARALYPAARRAFVARDLTGTVTLHLTMPFDHVSRSDLEDAALRLRQSTGTPRPLAYSWGTLTYARAARRVPIATTRLYSPYYLEKVFGWDSCAFRRCRSCSSLEGDHVFRRKPISDSAPSRSLVSGEGDHALSCGPRDPLVVGQGFFSRSWRPWL